MHADLAFLVGIVIADAHREAARPIPRHRLLLPARCARRRRAERGIVKGVVAMIRQRWDVQLVAVIFLPAT
eukprot:4477509-Prymnesium_polylepis.2